MSGALQSRMFQNFPADLLLSLAIEPLTANFHKWSLSVKVLRYLHHEVNISNWSGIAVGASGFLSLCCISVSVLGCRTFNLDHSFRSFRFIFVF